MKLSIVTEKTWCLSSTLKAEDIQLLKKYNSDALTIKDDDGNIKFAIGYTEGKPGIASFGLTFSQKSFSDGTVSIMGSFPDRVQNSTDAKEYLADTFGEILGYLNAFEEAVPNAVARVKAIRENIINDITVA